MTFNGKLHKTHVSAPLLIAASILSSCGNALSSEKPRLAHDGSVYSSSQMSQADAAWARIMTKLPEGPEMVSPIASSSRGFYRALAFNYSTAITSNQSRLIVDVFHFYDKKWIMVGNAEYRNLFLESQTVANSIAIANLLPSDRPSFFLTVQGASNPFNAVVANVAGHGWAKVPFVAPSVPGETASYSSTVNNASLTSDGRIIDSTENNCVPNCAQGARFNISYHYLSSESAFVALRAPSVTRL